MKPLVVGHRGAAAHALENTSASFDRAVAIGVDMIELDVHESLDGEFIVIHDAHLGRVSSGTDVVRKTHSKILKSVKLRNGQSILTLAEASRLIPRAVGLMVEVKAMHSFDKLSAWARQELSLREVMVTSFDLSLLLKLKAAFPQMIQGVVSKTTTHLSRAKALGLNARAVCVDYRCLSRASMPNLRQEWRQIFAWTVDRRQDIERMLELGVDGIISNRPDIVREALARWPGTT
jgi:glycerophosphoryl diester phosphodiesterase